jgi:hypothetical protein
MAVHTLKPVGSRGLTPQFHRPGSWHSASKITTVNLQAVIAGESGASETACRRKLPEIRLHHHVRFSLPANRKATRSGRRVDSIEGEVKEGSVASSWVELDMGETRP